MKETLIVITSLLILWGCNPSKTNKSKAPAAIYQDTITDLSNRRVVKDFELYSAITESFSLDTIYLIKDSLHFVTSKLQACDPENFKLIWNGRKTKSLPPQTSLRLYLMSDTECREQHRFHLSYNVASLREKNDSLQSMTLKVGGAKQSLLYK